MNTSAFDGECTPDRLEQLLFDQCEILESLLAAGEQQMGAIEQGHVSELLSILAAKQPQLEALSVLRERLQAWRPIVESPGFWGNEVQRRRCQSMRQSVQNDFERLMQLEQASEQSLTVSRNQIANRLQQFDSGRAVASAYATQSPAPPVPRGGISFSG